VSRPRVFAACLLLLVALGAALLVRFGPDVAARRPNLITRPGAYVSSDGRFSLTIAPRDGGLAYRVTDATTGRVVVDDASTSPPKKWFFAWSENGLWFYLGDTHAGVWLLTDGEPQRLSLDEVWSSENLYEAVPQAFYLALPASSKDLRTGRSAASQPGEP